MVVPGVVIYESLTRDFIETTCGLPGIPRPNYSLTLVFGIGGRNRAFGHGLQNVPVRQFLGHARKKELQAE